MNREIKFRVWDTELNKWATQLNLAGREPMITLDGVQAWTANLHTFNSPAEPNRYIYEQYTGFKDHKDREIYEGDIINLLFSKGYERDDFGDYYGKYEVIFKFGAWKLILVEEGDLDLWLESSDYLKKRGMRKFETIGNVHENKDLPT